jgi:glycosyltransferase involved in cell wall biosynthesis
VVRHATNRGYGAALKSGIAAARHSLIAVVDADGTYPIPELPRLASACEGAHMVIGSRTGKNVQAAPARSAAKWLFRLFARWVTRTPIPDLNSGLRVFRREVAERYMSLLPNGFSFTTTITMAALADDLIVRFEPVDYMPRVGRSKVHPVRDTTRIARQVLWLGWTLAPLRSSVAMLAFPLGAAVASSVCRVLADGSPGVAEIAVVAGVGAGLAIGYAAEHRVRLRRNAAAVTGGGRP